jgi:hypothetical protein
MAGFRTIDQLDARGKRVLVRADDFHVRRFEQRRTTTTLFAVDASGSSALYRLAEAKGAVELLLAECYVRRDQVAVLTFRGQGAELLLPPTRSLVRAKRALAGMPGGGGTPLAAGLDAVAQLADQVRVELSRVAVKQRLHITWRRLRRCASAFDAGQQVALQRGVSTMGDGLAQRGGIGGCPAVEAGCHVEQRGIAAGADLGDDRGDHAIDAGRRLACLIEEGGEGGFEIG